MSMPDPRRGALHPGLLFGAALLLIGVILLVIPMFRCPNCAYISTVYGTRSDGTILSIESDVQLPQGCTGCGERGKVSLLRKWLR
jgi:hypothetical protein